MKIGTKTTFGKLKVGDRFSSLNTNNCKIERNIKVGYVCGGIKNRYEGINHNGYFVTCYLNEAVTYLGRGF